MLGFMERQHGRGGGDPLQQAPPLQFLGTGRPPASLQFQVRGSPGAGTQGSAMPHPCSDLAGVAGGALCPGAGS